MCKNDCCRSAIVDILLWRLRLITETQLIGLFANKYSPEIVCRALQYLVRKKTVRRIRLERPVLQLSSPMFCFRPEEETEPEFSQLSWQMRKRLAHPNHEPHSIYLATEYAEITFGGISGMRQPFQINHDLGTASVFICRYLNSKCSLAWSEWAGEDVVRRFHRRLGIKKIPDAAILSSCGQLRMAIEFGGRDYSPRYLRKFHHHWKTRGVGYELW